MTISSAAMARMASYGLSLEQILDVVRTEEEAIRDLAQPKQSGAARRQKAYRERQKASRVMGGDGRADRDTTHNEVADLPVTMRNAPHARAEEIISNSENTGSISSLRSESNCPSSSPGVTSAQMSLAVIPALVPASDLPAPTARPKRAKSVKPPAAPPGEFEKWWDEYPNKVSKKEAIAAFDKAWALLSLSHAYPGDVLWNGLQNYKRKVAGWEKRHIRHAATWLNAENWNDEEHADGQGTGPSSGRWGDQRTDNIRSFFTPAAKARGFGE